jgi:hypothetical protein
MRLSPAVVAAVAAVLVAGVVLWTQFSGDDDNGGGSASTTTVDDAGGTGQSDGARDAAGDSRQPTPAAVAADERAGRRTLTESYRGIGAVRTSWFVGVDANLRAGLESAQGDEGMAKLCDSMSSAARRETIRYSRQAAGLDDLEWTCEKAVALLIRRSNRDPSFPKRMARARVVAMNVEGDRATATVDFGGRSPLTTVALVREDGEWKLGSTPAGASGGQP